MTGRAAICRMPARSAPSAKIFTFNAKLEYTISSPGKTVSGPQDKGRCVSEGFYRKVWRLRPLLRVGVVNEKRLAAGRVGRPDVAPPIAHHVTVAQIDMELRRRIKKQARHRLAAAAVVVFGVKTHLHRIDRQRLHKVSAHGLGRRPG